MNLLIYAIVFVNSRLLLTHELHDSGEPIYDKLSIQGSFILFHHMWCKFICSVKLVVVSVPDPNQLQRRLIPVSPCVILEAIHAGFGLGLGATPTVVVTIHTISIYVQSPYFLLNLSGSAFGGFQVLNKGGVSEEVPPSRRETREEGVFKLLQLDLELILLLCQLSLQVCMYVWTACACLLHNTR